MIFGFVTPPVLSNALLFFKSDRFSRTGFGPVSLPVHSMNHRAQAREIALGPSSQAALAPVPRQELTPNRRPDQDTKRQGFDDDTPQTHMWPGFVAGGAGNNPDQPHMCLGGIIVKALTLGILVWSPIGGKFLSRNGG